MSKYLDDLVLTFTIMSQNSLFKYDEYVKNSINKSQLKLAYSRILMSNITLPSINFEYKIDQQVEPIFESALGKFKKLNNIQVTELPLDLKNISDTILTIERHDNDLFKCLNSCRRLSTDEYLGDAARFQSDAPYRNLNSLFHSPLLSQRWVNEFKPVMVANPAQNCSAECASYDKFLVQFRAQFVQSWFQHGNVDVLLLPLQLWLPNLANDTSADDEDALYILCSITGYACLNVPVGYTPKTKANPNGLPVSLALMCKKENLLKAFRIANLFEKAYGVVALPFTSPL
jgi:Asp-tRNA(Asn)/Glu-tRNA(Gln) amidotransferase A subunit family amidase